MLNELNPRQERERMIEEITERVLQRISVRADTQQAKKEVKGLGQVIDNLFAKEGK